MTLLVLLRITIGWHFLYAGLWKLNHPEFSSEGFLSQAKGPLADWYLDLIPDRDGRQRLDPKNWEQHAGRLDAYFDKFLQHYQLSEEQTAKGRQAVASSTRATEEYLEENRPAIEDYLHELERLDKAGQSPSRNVPYEQQRRVARRAELAGEARTWLDELDHLYGLLRRDLDGILTAEQRGTPPPVEPVRQIRKMDLLVTYSNIAIGACLIAGLFTRLAAFGGGLFLLSIVLAQPDWPGLYPPPPPSTGRSLIVTKEFVEMMALFALAATRVGRWGGLDFFIHHLLIRPLFGKRQPR